MKKIIFSLLVSILSLSCATTQTIPEKTVVQNEQPKVLETKTESKSWTSCDYTPQINQGMCIFFLTDQKDEVSLGQAARTIVETQCGDRFVYTDVFSLPYKDEYFYIYFKCRPQEDDPSDKEEGRSL